MPKCRTVIATTGTGNSTHKVSDFDKTTITEIDKTMVTMVVPLYMIPGPSTMRTEFKSFVARDISSPVRLRT